MYFRICILFLLGLSPTIGSSGTFKHVKHKYWTDSYDRHFRKYSKHYFGPNFSWYWFKAQGIAESGLKKNAVSSAGAKGIMQILPTTFGDIIKKNPSMGTIDSPKWNIAAGIYYDRLLYKKWRKKEIPPKERLSYTFASYNAGYTKVLKAFNKITKGKEETPPTWQEVKDLTPGPTRAYVHRIKKLMQNQ